MLQFVITWLSVRSRVVRKLVKARPTLLAHDGRILHDVLARFRVTETEVFAAVREKGLAGMSEVHALVLETSGKFSIVGKPVGEDRCALAVVDGADHAHGVPARRGECLATFKPSAALRRDRCG
jgi:uncharacterized membrane protein YcaP (DUF421 family)